MGRRLFPLQKQRLAAVGLLPTLSVLAGWLVASPQTVRWGVTAAAIGLVVAVVVRSPTLAVLLLICWLGCLGTLRRLMSTVGGSGPLGDPLLLVGPASWVMLAAVATSRGALRDRTQLTNAVVVLITLFTLSAVNPLQGSLTVGLAGLLLVAPPILAFVVGRTLSDGAARRIISLIAILAVPAAIYGLIQTFLGFPSWDAKWIAEFGYSALHVGATIRPFASFASAAEYASFLGAGIVAWLALARSLDRPWVVSVVVALLGAALWLEAVRSLILLTVLAVGAVVSARRALPMRWAVLGAVGLMIALPAVVGRLAPQPGGGPSGDLAAHSAAGISDPFGEQSTLTAHVGLVTEGIQAVLVDPLGAGVGTVTGAAEKYGGNGRTAEADPGDVALAVGLPGFLAYFLITVQGLRLAYRLASQRRDAVALAALGILVVTLFHWLTGGQYSSAPLPWLMLGWLDAQQGARPEGASDVESMTSGASVE